MGIAFWSLIKTAATNIPWTRVAESTPLIVDMLGKAKIRIKQNEAAQKSLEDQLTLLLKENARQATDLKRMSDKIQVLTSRVSRLTTLTGISLLAAVAALMLWAAK